MTLAKRAMILTTGKAGNHRLSSFTLIELLIVVVIIAILSAIAVPNFLKVSSKARRAAMAAAEQARLREAVSARVERASTVAPVIEQANLSMQLAPSYRQVGMDVYTRYEAKCEGKIRFRHPEDTTAPVLLTLPLPSTAVEARDTAIDVSVVGGSEAMSKGRVSRELSGLYWQGELQPGAVATANVRFTCTGGQRFAWKLPPAQFLQGVNVSLEINGDVTWTIPDSALQPTQIEGKQLMWNFGNVISNSAIEIEVPPMLSPNGRVVLLCRLVAVAVLLFGFGIWYLSEQGKPGRLAKFRLGHFLLLALTYSLFFVIFAVLVLQGSTSTITAMAVAAVLSLPLLVLHVSRFTDMRFAVFKVLPLAVFTLGLVINGVYGGKYRDYVYIGAVTFVVGYLTLTYRGWAKGRQELREKRIAELRETVSRLQEKCAGEMGTLAQRLREGASRIELLIKGKDQAEGSRRYVLQGLVSQTEAVLKEHDKLAQTFPSFRPHHYLSFHEYQREVEGYERSLQALITQTEGLLANVDRELAAVSHEHPKPRVEEGMAVHCIACGAVNATAPFCRKCGTRQPFVMACCVCNDRMVMPLSLLDRAHKEVVWHCMSCGTRNEFTNPIVE